MKNERGSIFDARFGLADYIMYVWFGLVVATIIITPIWLISELRRFA